VKILLKHRKIKKELEDYCGLDTEGMRMIVDKLRGIIKQVD